MCTLLPSDAPHHLPDPYEQYYTVYCHLLWDLNNFFWFLKLCKLEILECNCKGMVNYIFLKWFSSFFVWIRLYAKVPALAFCVAGTKYLVFSKPFFPFIHQDKGQGRNNYSRNGLNKHCENRKTLPWEHHIGCQICRITLSKSTEKVIFYSSDSSDSSEKKNYATSQKILFFSTLFERAIWHIWQPMWCSQGSVLRFLQCYLLVEIGLLLHLFPAYIWWKLD